VAIGLLYRPSAIGENGTIWIQLIRLSDIGRFAAGAAWLLL